MSKLEADDHLVLKDDPDDENGANIQKINGDLETQRMLWGFPAKNPLTAPKSPALDDGYLTIKPYSLTIPFHQT